MCRLINFSQDAAKSDFLNLILVAMHNLNSRPLGAAPDVSRGAIRIRRVAAHPKLMFIDVSGISYHSVCAQDLFCKLLQGANDEIKPPQASAEFTELCLTEMVANSLEINAAAAVHHLVWVQYMPNETNDYTEFLTRVGALEHMKMAPSVSFIDNPTMPPLANILANFAPSVEDRLTRSPQRELANLRFLADLLKEYAPQCAQMLL